MFRFRRSTARCVFAGLWFLALMSTAGAQDAALGIPSNAPGASLLVPYFEVDLDPDGERTTLISIRATSPDPGLTHMTIWSDLGVPVISFSIYLTGYDEQSINLRDILVDGLLPQTAPITNDPADVISPQGRFSGDTSFPNCSSLLPPPDLNPFTRAHITSGLTGEISPFNGLCYGRDHGDDIARGYVTIDTVAECATQFPVDPGYFIQGGVGIATNDNVLRGEFMLVDPSTERLGESDLRFLPAVLLRASGSATATSTPGNPTFYGFSNSGFAEDNREALPSRWRAPIDGASDLVVWRGPESTRNPFTCGVAPAFEFDPGTDRTVVSPRGNGETLGPPADSPFPLVAQRVFLGRDTPDAVTGFQIKPAGFRFNAEHSGANSNLADPTYQQALIITLGLPSGLPAGQYSSDAVPLQSAYDNPNFAN